MPPRTTMIMVLKLSGSWKPRAAERIRPMVALSASEILLVSFHLIVASMEVRSLQLVQVSFTESPRATPPPAPQGRKERRQGSQAGTCHAVPLGSSR